MGTMKGIAVLTGLLLLSACRPYNVNYDYDARANYASYKTFDWYAASKKAQGKADKVENPLMDKRVRNAIELELVAKGFKREASADPDFLVTYYPVYHNRRVRTYTHVGWGWGWRPFGVGMGTTFANTRNYKEGTIVIEVVDYKSNELVWKSAAEGALTGLDNPEDAEECVTSAVKRMLEDFPPTLNRR
jgi:hypothetical protein